MIVVLAKGVYLTSAVIEAIIVTAIALAVFLLVQVRSVICI